MMRICTLVFWLLLPVVPAVSQSERNARPLTAQASEKWVIKWNRSDDFKGEEVDWRKWNKRPENFGAWTWDNDSNATVANGVLTLTVRRVDSKAGATDVLRDQSGNPTPFTSGMLKSYAVGTYGYYEARIKGSSVFPGVCPSFWLYSKIDDSIVSAGEVRYSEIDIVELSQRGDRVEGNRRIMDHNLHAIVSNGKPGIAGRGWQRPNDERFQDTQANEYKAPFDPGEDFHTYGCRVGREEIVWYVDGVEVGRKKNVYWAREMNVAISLGLRAPFAVFADNRLRANVAHQATELPTTMEVDYVRVWELEE
ncbi:family 16 glycosylhydrolase [Rhodopirellula sp. P2]|uniref:family 16 glycosylhydrolase n=1 Tax=Rhodopirellula sp. P2 TaxID=2127060 RepID=UPI0030843ADB